MSDKSIESMIDGGIVGDCNSPQHDASKCKWCMAREEKANRENGKPKRKRIMTKAILIYKTDATEYKNRK